MMQKLGQKGLWKLIVYFTYLCVQVVILGALMLTTTSMVAHTIMMLLSIIFYFAVCFKDPGTYIANSEPNLQDLSTSHRSKLDLKSKSNKKKIVSDQIHQKDESQQDESQQVKKPTQAELKNHKKNSIDLTIQDELAPKEQAKKVQINRQQPKNNPKEKDNMITSAKNILNSAFSNLTTFMSKKNIETCNIEQQKSVIKEETQIKEQTSVKEIPNKHLQSKKQSKQQQKEIEQKMNAHPIQKGNLKVNKKSIIYRMQHKKRYCRICEFYQPMRVRHCYSCQSCVSTFDHHCPWLSTCIGQKNKLVFIGYLFVQTLQFFVIFIDLVLYVSQSFHTNKSSVGILLLAVLLILIVLLLLLSFHLYLAFHNLTTWELFRWDRIQYLSLFDKTILRSPFSKGIKQNLKTLWQISLQPSNKKWQEQLTEELSKYVLKGRYSEKQEGTTERKMFLSHQNI